MSAIAGGRSKRAYLSLVPNARDADELEFLPAALEIIETPASPAGRRIAGLIAAAAITAIVWASIAQVDILISAPGRIVPVGRSKVLQPFQEGIVQSILVNDGDHVQAGQALITFDPTQAKADVLRFAQDLQNEQLDEARLQSLRSVLGTDAAPQLNRIPAAASAEAVASATAQMQAQYLEEAGKIAAIDEQMAEKQFEVKQAVATIDKVQVDKPFLQQIAGMRTSLLKQAVGSKLDWLTAEEQLADTGPSIALAQAQQGSALADVAALQREREQVQAEYAKNIFKDLDDTEQKIDESTQDLSKAEQQLALTTLQAPISGTVQQLAVHTVGGIVTPAQALLTVVPDSQQLMVEASIKNQDIGFVRTGQTAEVKIGAFDFTRFGMVKGTVISISRDVVDMAPSQAPEDDGYNAGAEPNGQTQAAQASQGLPQEPDYVAHIALSQSGIQTDQGLAEFQPGMAVTADIKTGRRHIISYLLSPFARQVDDAAHER